MLMNSKVSLLIFVLCLNGIPSGTIGSENQEKENLIPNQSYRLIENENHKINKPHNTGLTESRETRKLRKDIDFLVQKFANYENLSTQEQNDLLNEQRKAVHEMKIRIWFVKGGSVKHTSISSESDEKFKKVSALYSNKEKPDSNNRKTCVIF